MQTNPDPLAGYTPDWRQSANPDPLAGYNPDWRKKLDPEPKRSVLDRAKGLAGNLLAGPAQAVLSTQEGLANLAAAGLDKIGLDRGAESFREHAEELRDDYEMVDRVIPTKGTAETVARVGSRIAGEGAQFVMPGGAVSKIPKVAKLSKGKKFGAMLAADAPLDAALGASSTSSTAQALSDMTDAEWLDRIAQDPTKRAAFEVLTGMTAVTALTALGKGGGAAVRKAREAMDVTPDVDAAVREGFGPEGLKGVEGEAQIPRMPYSDPDPMSARAAALRRSDPVPRLRDEDVPFLPEPAPRKAPLLEEPLVIGGRGQKKARVELASEDDVRAFMREEATPGRDRPIQDVGTWIDAVRRKNPERPFLPEPEPRMDTETSARRPMSLGDARTRYGRSMAQATMEEAESAAAGSPVRLKFEQDQTGTIGAVGTGKGAFARGRRTQALNRADEAGDQLRRWGGVAPDPDVAVREAIDADPEILPLKLREEYTTLNDVADADLLARVGEAEEAAYRNQDNAAMTARRAMLAGEAKKRGLLEQQPGAAHPAVVAALGRTGAGAAVGAVVDDEDPLRGAAIGGAAANVPSVLRTAAKNAPVRELRPEAEAAFQAQRARLAEEGRAEEILRESLLDRAQQRTGERLALRAGSAAPEVVGAVARTGVGAAAGAAVDDENRLRGAAVGAAAANAPAAVRAMRGSSKDAPAYMSDPAVRQVLQSVSKGDEGSLLHRLSGAPTRVAKKLYVKMVDETQPLRDFGRAMEGNDRLSHNVSQAKGWRGGAQQRLDSEFQSVIDAARGNEDGVVALATAERAIELARHGMADKGVDLSAAQATVAALGKIPEVRQATDQLRAYYRQLLQLKLDNGVITPEQFAEYTAKGDFYVPFVRDFGDATRPPSAGGGKFVNRGTGVRKMTDEKASSPIVDPFEQAVLDTFEAHRTVAKQRVTNVVSAIVEADPAAAAPFLRKLEGDAKPRTGREVAANVNGSRQRYEVLDEDLFNAWAAFDNRTQNLFVKVFGPFKRALQVTVTVMPDFAIRNAIRDNAQSAIQYGMPVRSAAGGAAAGAGVGAAVDEDNRLGGAMAGAGIGMGLGVMGPQAIRVGRAMGDIVGRQDIYQEWLREGGSGFSEFYARPSDARRMLRKARGDRSIADTIMMPVDGLQAFGRLIEEAPRLARYKQMRASGADVPEAIASARDISLDFANIGADPFIKGAAGTTAFFNAKIQGWDKLIRLLKNPKTWATGAATLTAPSVALWSINKDDPEYWERPQWERNLFWLVPNPDGGFYRVPKPFEVGFLFASLPERILDYAYERDPETLAFALKDMLNTTGEGTFPVPTGLLPIGENIANYSLFTNRPIVPMGLESLPDEMQYDNRTSALSRGLAKIPGIPDSPMKTENLLRGWTGNVGREVMAATDRVARATGLDDRPAQARPHTPIFGSFMTKDGSTTDQEMALRRRFEKAERIYRGAKRLADKGDPKAEQYVRDNLDMLTQYESLKSQMAVVDEVWEARRTITDADIPAKQKQAMLVHLNQFIAEVLSGRGEAQAQPPTR